MRKYMYINYMINTMPNSVQNATFTHLQTNLVYFIEIIWH